MRHTRETVAAMFGSMRAGPKFNQGRSCSVRSHISAGNPG